MGIFHCSELMEKKKEHPKEKELLHPRNKHRKRYDFKELTRSCPELAPYVTMNAYQDESIDFFNPQAVKMLNTALLKHFYDLDYWDIPPNYLCPPIPGRADYIHHVADLLASKNKGIVPPGREIRCLDIGVGANCVYPIIGHKEYDWSFTGTDIDRVSLEAASKIIKSNPSLHEKIELRWQKNPKDIFYGIIQKEEYFDLTICNPPFHASLEESQSATLRKLSNLKHKKTTHLRLNFGGQNNELWCEGGEEKFVRGMVHQSKKFSTSCFWFSTLLSKQSNLRSVYSTLENAKAAEVKTIPMGQGNKTSRIIAWTFLTEEQQQFWINTKWNNVS